MREREEAEGEAEGEGKTEGGKANDDGSNCIGQNLMKKTTTTTTMTTNKMDFQSKLEFCFSFFCFFTFLFRWNFFVFVFCCAAASNRVSFEKKTKFCDALLLRSEILFFFSKKVFRKLFLKLIFFRSLFVSLELQADAVCFSFSFWCFGIEKFFWRMAFQ